METAIHVAKASNLCSPGEDNIAIFQCKTVEEIEEAIQNFEQNNNHQVIAIDGPSVSLMLADPNLEKRFFQLAINLDSVIFVRLTPN